MVNLLAPYLAHNIEVHSPAHGRGLLVGLPYSQRWERPQAEVRFGPDSDTLSWEVFQLDKLKPVLYSAADAERLGMLRDYNADHLAYFAELVDEARAKGIALNLPEGSYVRKEVAHV